uniref:MYND-type domain-containing protein n=1 Tax=Clastoptera arizonana TaxID=38151 RepID=A0A1B6CWC9_9HEMI
MMPVLESKIDSFKNYHTNFRNSLTTQDLNHFSSLSNDIDRFSFVYGFPSAHEYKIVVYKQQKSIELATHFKEDGNKAFQNGKYKVALHLYSRAILESPQDSEQNKNEKLSILYANRSAALYHLKHYQLTLQDIELAIGSGYPKDIKYKICDRKARSLLALNQLKDARDAFRETLTALDVSKLPIEKRQKQQKDVQIMIAMLDKNKSLSNAPLPKDPSVEIPALTDGHNSYYHSASSIVNVKETPEFGRYAVAGRNIKVGEVLLTEKPYCSMLLAEFTKTNCFNCFKRALVPLPCPWCNNILFCSLECQKEALRTHHKIECSILNTLWKSGASLVCFMSLRILSQSGLDLFLKLQPVLKQGKPKISSKSYKNTDYLTIYNLVGHEDRRSTEDFLHRTHMATFLFRCLKKTNFFGNIDDKPETNDLTQEELYIGSLILHHLQVLQFNAHEVCQLVVKNIAENSYSQFIGGAVYPTLALFNHSCNPGIVRYYKGNRVVVQAIRKTLEGEMIAENYGPIFTQTPRKDRQETCKNQYWFECSCQACEEDWPTFDNMIDGNIRFRCETKGCNNILIVPINTMQLTMKCHGCGKSINILKGLKTLQDTDVMFKIAQKNSTGRRLSQGFDQVYRTACITG